eukprot:symbB.v1.2.038085.t1/scaffold5799.1/size23532/1
MTPSPADKENAPPAQENHNDADSKESKAHAARSFVSACFVFSCPVEVLRHDMSLAILQKQDHIQSFQKWWSEGRGNEAAASHALLHVDEAVLKDVISAGIDKLDALLNKLDESAGDNSLDPLRKALQTKGGARNQARAVGALLFATAQSIYECTEDVRPAVGDACPSQMCITVSNSQGEEGRKEVELTKTSSHDADENRLEDLYPFDPPKNFETAPSFPDNLILQFRRMPNEEGELISCVPGVQRGATIVATGQVGQYLQTQVGPQQASERNVWVPRVLDGLVLFVEKSDPAKVDKEAEAEHPAGSTEEAILEQQDQVQRFQSWWAEGQGMVGARSHPMLSILDATVLGDIIAAGANYHNCLSADRLDTLQRHVSKSSAPGLDALRRALQAKGGAKSQARAVGSVIFKEAMDMFKHPPSDLNRASPALAASPGESQGEQPGAPSLEQARPNACVVADEIFDPPKRFVCSESFPPEATVAVRSAPSHQSEYLTCLPHGTEIMSSGRFGDFLRFTMQAKEGASQADVYVPLVFRGVTLFVPAPKVESASSTAKSGLFEADRMAQLEDRVLHQETIIKALQAELSALRAHMSAVATAFGTLASRSS